MKEVHLKKSEVLFAEGDPARNAYQVKEGKVGIFIEVSGKLEKVGDVGEGEFIGEMGLVSSASRSATAIAETPVSLLVFSNEDFETRLQASDPVVRKVLEGSMDRIRKDHSKLEASVQIRTLYRMGAATP